jgi:endonuclease YncB( thermonuclease family)
MEAGLLMQRLTQSILSVLAAAVVSGCASSKPLNFQARGVGAVDGDTLDVQALVRDSRNGAVGRLALAGIDCPESDQPYGDEARAFVDAFCRDRELVVTITRDSDRLGHHEAMVSYRRADRQLVSLQEELLKAGLAWSIRRAGAWAELEASARRKRHGLWAQGEPIAPWTWRQEKLLEPDIRP